MDASVSSQFEQQVRTLAGMPLGATDSVQPAVMLNVLGDIWFLDGRDQPQEPAWDRVLALPGVHVHLYGKTVVRRGRKMGHVNVVAASAQLVQQRAEQAAQILGIVF